MDLAGIRYIEFAWSELDWAGLGWAGLGWVGLDWTGLDSGRPRVTGTDTPASFSPSCLDVLPLFSLDNGARLALALVSHSVPVSARRRTSDSFTPRGPAPDDPAQVRETDPTKYGPQATPNDQRFVTLCGAPG
ncbi:hypothetical protein E2C01_005418 [Portunus trituberculatus]|uniref:Uncharacterized protein n=1 Tax=Portunus trituberculatus TaxID=210409 RepID=A0A5B7CZ48_PORTR|nr:hypothetical protein [Portunus trituberculatus]